MLEYSVADIDENMRLVHIFWLASPHRRRM